MIVMKALAVALLLFCGSAVAAETAGQQPEARGPVTNLPLPRFVSMKAAKANVRRGPSPTHRIDWVFQHRNMPLEVTAEYGHWRRVRDIEGAGGWVHYALLSGARHVLIQGQNATLRERPQADARPVALAEAGAVLRLGKCDKSWCRVQQGRVRGWIERAQVWGVFAHEIRE